MNTSISKEISERDKVIIGADGWLFLGNDSNNSTAQFIGEINLGAQEREKFRLYLQAVKKKIFCDVFFSIAPNKEFVHPEKYPFLIKEKGGLLVHEQAISILAEHDVPYHYPVEELASIPNSFYKTDTHWSEYGAYKTLSNFFLSHYRIDLVDLNDKDFLMEYVAGDLGNKLDGQKDGRLSYNFKIDEYELFNSGLKNHGYGVHYVNPNASIDKKILVFGDSFGISYIKPLVLTFREVVFLYSPATFIENVYDHFLPDLVILQINQRFLLDPPNYRLSLENSLVFKKFKNFDLNETKSYVQTIEKQKNSFLKYLYLKPLAGLIPTRNTTISNLLEKKMLFNGEYVEVRSSIFDAEKNKIVVTFTARSDSPQKNGFGEEFFEKNNISAIHFISKSNHWWQVDEMRSAIQTAAALVKNYIDIYTYGASMGGHGALIFSKELNASHIIVGSPQFAIKGRLTPWTPRWHRDTKGVNEIFTIEDGLAKNAKIYCIYDPFNHFDRLHIAQIKNLVSLNFVRTCFSDHSSILHLKNMGVLSDLLKTIIFRPENLKDIINNIKIKRSKNLKYLLGLEKRSAAHKCRGKVEFWAKEKAFLIAREGTFDGADQFSQTDVAVIFKRYCSDLIKSNLVKEAINFAEEYCQRYPDTYLSHDLLSNVYWKSGNHMDALLESKRALRLNRQNASLRVSVVRLHIILEQFDEALHHLDVAIAFPSKDKKSWIALLKDLADTNVSLDVKSKVEDKIREIDPSWAN